MDILVRKSAFGIRRSTVLMVLFLLSLLMIATTQGCRRVALVGDSLLECARDPIVSAINSNAGESWVYVEHMYSGSTAYNNPINRDIYREGMAVAFGRPDVVVMSFAGNDMGRVTAEVITMESAIEAMQTIINQAVVAGAMCIVMLESSHRLAIDHPDNPVFEMHMDDWFDHWHRKVGDNEYLGIPYTFLIADISEQVEANMAMYIEDYIHFSHAGAELAANAIVEEINKCPGGRWIFGADQLKPGVGFPPNPHKEYGKKPKESAKTE